ncbi:MFS transporter [Cysteiniphilum sp. QT6929]|uniref:MFS transporter n=1 Tax=Cysteiniphilum sp. QT6929 TaxID=2975055 RepID=UPI0024B3C64A|nr:MFS transporter [Cysteiniphilum sp. QT6929]WHN65421.1 MFS transporter [Cysteiniphilum sp. QT6929]
MKAKTLTVAWLIWLVAAIFYALDYFQHTAPSVLLAPIAHSLNLDINQVVSVMAIYFPIYAIAQIPAGLMLDRFGCKWTLSLSCLVMSLGILVFIWDQSLSMMWIGRILIAIGSAFAFLGALKVASDVLPNNVFPIAVGLTNTIGVLGGIFGQVLLAYWIEKLTWEGALWLIGYIGVIFSLVIYLCVRPREFVTHKAISRKLSKAHLYVLKSKDLWLIAIYAGIMVGTVVNAFSELYDVVFLQYTYQFDATTAASISVMIFIGIAVGGPTHGIVARLTNSKKAWMVITNVMTIIVFSLIVLLPDVFSISMLYVLYFLLGFFVSSMLLAFAVVDDIFPSKVHGTVLAVVNMTIGLSAALFQHLVDYVSMWINGGDLKEIHNPNVFTGAFLVLLLPLFLSLILLILTNVKAGFVMFPLKK